MRRAIPLIAALTALALVGSTLAADSTDGTRLVGSAPIGQSGDMAFWGDLMVAAQGFGDGEDDDDEGFAVLDISEPSELKTLSEVRCVASGYDVSIWRNLVIASQDAPSRGTACDAELAPEGGPGTFAGIRIFSIENPAAPRPLATVPTNCYEPPVPICPLGSHTHTVLPDLARDRLIVYASGVNTTVVAVPLRAPENPKVLGTVATAPSAGCHDLQILVEQQIAACSGITETQLWSLADLERPEVISHIDNPALEHHHSAVFSGDGKTLVLFDERNTLTVSRSNVCGGGLGAPVGALWFYDISNPRQPRPIRYFQISESVPLACYAHYGARIPTRDGRDLMTVGWVGAGSRVIDFSDPEEPVEIASFRRPDDREITYSAYWYRGYMYASNALVLEQGAVRGIEAIDVPALSRLPRLKHFNPQTQEPLE